jgi:hypothetical protein
MVDLNSWFTGRAVLRPMLGLALLGYCLLVIFPGEPAPAAQSAVSVPTTAVPASSAPVEPERLAQRS